MDDNVPKENPPGDFNKLDLSQLRSFSFGTQWTQEKPGEPDERRERGAPGGGARREAGAGPERRDRRTPRRPAGSPGEEGGAGARPERREFAGDRYPRREGGGDFRGGPRREGGYAGDRGGPRHGHGGLRPQERGPYESPYYNATFYPEDSSFNTLVQTIRRSCRTVELFEIARTVVAKTDRFVVVMTHKPAPERAAPAPKSGEEPAGPERETVQKTRPLFHISVPDGMPFETDEAAVAHVLGRHLDKFFEMAEVEVEPPRGNFQVINKCGITGELLGPPNYHRYNQIVVQHHAAKVARMSLEAFRSRIETVRDPEVVNQWLAKMKKATRYTWKAPGTRPAGAQAPASEPAREAGEGAGSEPQEASPAAATEATPVVPTFDTLEDARLYLLTQARDKVVRTSETARFHGTVAETMPPGEMRRAVEGALERQRRFPLDTANALRGRLRREHFTIFKKGSKGISYVCAVKRKFRVPGQTFADSIGALISFIEANPMIRASELAGRFLGLKPPVAAKPGAPEPAPVEAAAPTSGPAAGDAGPVAGEATPAPIEPPKPEELLSVEDRARISRVQNDLVWLVREGYVTEFIDGRLFAPPPVVEARKKEIESEEHDPENYPEVPAGGGEFPPQPAQTSPASEPGETAAASEVPAESGEDLPRQSEPVHAVPSDGTAGGTSEREDGSETKPAPEPIAASVAVQDTAIPAPSPSVQEERRIEMPPPEGSPPLSAETAPPVEPLLEQECPPVPNPAGDESKPGGS